MDVLAPCLTLNNGVEMPQFGLGVWQSAAGADTENAVQWALEAGYRHIDTAAIYGNEESVGKAIAASNVPRKDIFLTTKLWNTEQGFDSTLKAFEISRKKLGVDYVDLYLIHWPGGTEVLQKKGKQYLDTWRAMEYLYKEKKVRAIGISNFKRHHIEDILAMCTVTPMVNQVELHPRHSQKALREYCATKNIIVTAWSPLGQGNLLTYPALQAIGAQHGKTAAQVILRWELQLGLITIPKSIHKDRIYENAGIFDFELSSDEMRSIDTLNEDKPFGPDPDDAGFGF